MNNSYKKFYLNDSISFKKTTERWGGLSNMANFFYLNVNNISIQSSEILYQACRFPLYPEIQEKILSQDNPMIAKRIAKSYQDKTRSNWDSNRVSIMKWVVLVKLCQNWNKFYYLLNETGSKSIVEHSEKDLFWGAQRKEEYYYGVNALGRILMQAREHARTLGKEGISQVVPLKIPHFKLLNENIRVVYSNDKNNSSLLPLINF